MIAKPSTSFGRRYDQVARIAPGTRQKNESIRKRSKWPETHSRTSAFVKFIYSHCLAEDIEVGGVTKPCFDQTWPSINHQEKRLNLATPGEAGESRHGLTWACQPGYVF